MASLPWRIAPASQLVNSRTGDFRIRQPRRNSRRIQQVSRHLHLQCGSFTDSRFAGGPALWRRDVSSTNLYRPSPRQGNDAFKTRIIVCKCQFAAMEPCDGRSKAQTKAGSGFRTTLFQPYKTFDDARAVRFRDTRSAVGYSEQNAITLAERPHDNFRGHTVYRSIARFCVFDRVVDEVSERLTDKLTIAFQWRRCFSFHLKRNSFFFRQRFVQAHQYRGQSRRHRIHSCSHEPARILHGRSSIAR